MRNATLLLFGSLLILPLSGCTRGGSTADDENAQVRSSSTSESELQIGEDFVDATVEGETQGVSSGQEAGSDCVGYFPEEASHVMDVSEPRELRMVAIPSGALRDLTMAILTPSGEYLCNDDFDGLNPGFEESFAPGTYSIWVGVYRLDEPNSSAAYSLRVFDPEAAASEEAPDGPAPTTTSAGTYGGLRIAADTGLARIQGRAGGTREANSLAPQCNGYIAMEPDHVFELAATTELRVRVRSQHDTTLLLQGPGDEILCNDDFDGLNPGIDHEMSQGTWNVYVGTYAPSSYPEYTMTVSR